MTRYISHLMIAAMAKPLLFLIGVFLLPLCARSEDDLLQWVDPFIGTTASDSPETAAAFKAGNVNPGASLPWGMVQFSPDTPTQESTGYDYSDRRILSFSLTHLSGTGCANTSEIQLMPTVGKRNLKTTIEFSHDQERASPGYYSVKLANQVRTELTATPRTGFARFTFPAAESVNIVLDGRRNQNGLVPGELSIQSDHQISGWLEGGNFCGKGNRYRVYYWLEADRSFQSTNLQDGRALLTYDTRQNTVVRIKVGISYVSIQNARANLGAENPGWSFDRIHQEAVRQWREKLGKIRIEGGTSSQKRLFYTSLYRVLLHPNIYSDSNGEYLGFDNRVHRAVGYTQHANYSGWDIYRSQVQLIAWLFPEVGSDIAQSLVTDAKMCGAFPKWSQNNTETGVMVGDPGAAVVANLSAFGARRFDRQAALEIMKRTGTVPEVACQGIIVRPGLKDYRSLGYTSTQAFGVAGGAATTLEYVYADAAIARFAESLGEHDATRIFETQSASWLSLWDPETGLIRPRKKDGSWLEPFSDSTRDGYVEGTAAQYVWMVPHDPRTLIARMGGDTEAIRRLDGHLEKVNDGQNSTHFYIGNEPSFGTPWLYLWAHAPWRTQASVRRVLEESYLDRPSGLPGNDDMGATSSWYVWGALGLYPALPGVQGLAVASPLFPKTVISLPNGSTLTLLAKGAPAPYVQGARINGHPFQTAWLSGSMLQRGGQIEFELGPNPSRWGAAPGNEPPSFSPREFPDLSAAANSQGTTSDSAVRSRGDFNGFGYGYSKDSLQSLGFAPGATFESDGIRYRIVKSDTAFDNVIAAGQRIRFSTAVRASQIGFIGAANSGPSTGEVKLVYADGTFRLAELTLGDWNQETDHVVAKSRYRNRSNGEPEEIPTFLFEARLALDPSKELIAVELPSRVSKGRMHLFGMGFKEK